MQLSADRVALTVDAAAQHVVHGGGGGAGLLAYGLNACGRAVGMAELREPAKLIDCTL